RWAAPDDAESMRRYAKELVALQPDLILSGTTTTTAALLPPGREKHSQERETERASGPGPSQIRPSDQPKGRQGARPRGAADLARACRRGDRVKRRKFIVRFC